MRSTNLLTVGTLRPQGKTVISETWKTAGVRNADGKHQIRLEEDEVPVRDVTGWRPVVCVLCSTGNDKASIK